MDSSFSIFMHSECLFCICKLFFQSEDKQRFCFSSFKQCNNLFGLKFAFFLSLFTSVTSLLPLRPQTLELAGVPVFCFQSQQGWKVHSLCREVSWEIWGGTKHARLHWCFPLLLSVGAPRLHIGGFFSNWQPAVKRRMARPEQSAALSSQSIGVFHWWLLRLQPESQTETIQLLFTVIVKQAKLHLTVKVEKEIKNYVQCPSGWELGRTGPLCCKTVALAPPLSPQEVLIESPLTGNGSELSFLKWIVNKMKVKPLKYSVWVKKIDLSIDLSWQIAYWTGQKNSRKKQIRFEPPKMGWTAIQLLFKVEKFLSEIPNCHIPKNSGVWIKLNKLSSYVKTL